MKKAQTQTKKEAKIVDAAGVTLGRVASVAAAFLIGKDNPAFERNRYSGSPVKVINCSKLSITPKKLKEIFHTRYSGYPGGQRVITAAETSEKKGLKELVKLSIVGMLPKNKLKKEMVKNLKVED